MFVECVKPVMKLKTILNLVLGLNIIVMTAVQNTFQTIKKRNKLSSMIVSSWFSLISKHDINFDTKRQFCERFGSIKVYPAWVKIEFLYPMHNFHPWALYNQPG